MALVYLDAVIVFGRSFDEHQKRLERAFQRLAEIRIKIKGSKYIFFQINVSFLGHIISDSGVKVDPEKEKTIERMKEPSSLKDVRAFLGLVGLLSEIYSGFRKNSRTSSQFAE